MRKNRRYSLILTLTVLLIGGTIGAQSAHANETINAGGAARYVFISPNGATAVVASVMRDSVTIINLGNHDQRTISGISYPNDVAFSADSSLAYIVEPYSDLVEVVNLDEAEVIYTYELPIPSAATNLAMSPDGIHLYVSLSGGGLLMVINTVTHHVDGTYSVSSHPRQIRFDSSGAFAYIADTDDGKIVKWNTSTHEVVAVISSIYPIAMDISPDGSQLVAVDPNIQEVDFIDLQNFTFASRVTIGAYPWDVKFSPTGAFVLVAGEDQVLKIDTSNFLVSTELYVEHVYSVAFSPRGDFALVNSYLWVNSYLTILPFVVPDIVPTTILQMKRPVISRTGAAISCSSGSYALFDKSGEERSLPLTSQKFAFQQNGVEVSTNSTLNNSAILDSTKIVAGALYTCSQTINISGAIATFYSLSENDVAAAKRVEAAALAQNSKKYWSDFAAGLTAHRQAIANSPQKISSLTSEWHQTILALQSAKSAADAATHQAYFASLASKGELLQN